MVQLAGRAKEQVLAQQVWLGVDEYHRVLQLVAETEGAAPVGNIRFAPKGGTRASGTGATR